MASSGFINKWNYDVFLSFRGPDTRNTFIGHLYQALKDKGINVFIDSELERGEVITSQLLRDIEESRISIVVLSVNYASSSFCLNELVKILECRDSKCQTVIPVFYHVDPTDVEEQRGSFGEEFAKLEAQLNIPNLTTRPMKKRRINNEDVAGNMDRVRKWRLALTEVARLSGWHLQIGDHEATTIQSIIKLVLQQSDRTPLHVAEHPIGLASRINHILEELNMESNDVCMLGLHGMGGIGKTTTAKALYNKCITQFQFDGSCFLLNVRENSKKYDLAKLQENLLFEILGDEKSLIGNFEKGIELIKERLHCKRVLIVIDDVDCIEQLEKLAGELKWFGAGSRIIITTRDLHLLKAHGITRVHEIKKLENGEAMELFSWHAFRKPQPSETYMNLSGLIIRYGEGLPLALKVLGSLLFDRTILEWEEVMEKLERRPNKKITDILKISYDGLDSEEKVIFLDIAFFLKGKNKDEVINFLKVCGLGAYIGVQRLVEKSLVYIDEGTLEMHDLLKEMGTQIALEDSSRLCIQKREDIHMFFENKRACDVEGIILDSHEEELPLNFLENLRKLRILVIRHGRFTKMPKQLPNSIRWLEWCNFPLNSIPPEFLPTNLVVLEMPHSSIKKCLANEPKVQKFMNLARMDFKDCPYLKETFDFSAMPNLEVLSLFGCGKVKRIDRSIGSLKKLRMIWLYKCKSLTSLPNLEQNQSLEFINLDYCSRVKNLPNLPITLENLELNSSGIREIPSSIGDLVNLRVFQASKCKSLISVPNNIYKLPCLSDVELYDCPKLLMLPEADTSTVSANFTAAESLDLSKNKFVSLPTNIFKFSQITLLNLENCEWLVEIPELPHCLESLLARNCKSLVRFSQFQFDDFEGDFTDCHKLAEKEMQSWREMLQNVAATEMEGYMEYNIILPGNEIPNWFSYVIEGEGNALTFKLPPTVINENLIGIAWCAIVQFSEIEFKRRYSMNYSIHFSTSDLVNDERYLYFPLEAEHLWLGFNNIDFYFAELSRAEEISCKFYCDPKDTAVFKRVGVHFIYSN